jgi:putative membrane protein
MMILLRWVLFALAVLFIGWLLPGISISGFLAALILVVVIALINALLRPLINFLTLPINFLTLGLFGLVINALLFMLAGFLVPGVEIANFWWALLASLILSLLGMGIDAITNKSGKV